MRLRKQEHGLIHLLLRSRNFLTSSELANQMNVSKATVYRLVKRMNEKEKLILAEKGCGYKLNYDVYINRKCGEGPGKTTGNSNLSPVERRNEVMQVLLFKSPNPVKIIDLYRGYFVSDSVINVDEQAISNVLQRYSLKVVRKDRTLAVKGAEVEIRKAIIDLLAKRNMLDLADMSTKLPNYNKFDANFSLNQVKIIERQLGVKIPYPYNVNIFSHIYILITRARQGKVNGEAIDQLRLAADDKKLINTSPQLYGVAVRIIGHIENYLSNTLPNSEAIYLLRYLASSRLICDRVTFDLPRGSIVDQVSQSYISMVSQKIHVPINGYSLHDELAGHIKPMINRLNNHIFIKNNFLADIKLEYQKIFSAVHAVSKLIAAKYELPAISEDESGFITLYFAKYIEQHPRRIQVIIMCTTGVGTSELLRAKIKRSFPELVVVDVVADKDLKKALRQHPHVSLIITTIRIDQCINVPAVLVSTIFSMQDRDRVEEVINGFECR
jgi:activator of the mannose operon (transcriptional antiterminator)